MVTVSIVIPAKNEADNIAQLLADIDKACAPETDHEVIVVDDASTDATAATVQHLMETRPHLRLVRHERSAGQSAAVHSGVGAVSYTHLTLPTSDLV